MPQTVEEIKAMLKPRALIQLTCKGPSSFDQKIGYVGECFADSFEFLQVTNEYEHFSNISAGPETRTHVILYQDVINLKNYPF